MWVWGKNWDFYSQILLTANWTLEAQGNPKLEPPSSEDTTTEKHKVLLFSKIKNAINKSLRTPCVVEPKDSALSLSFCT